MHVRVSSANPNLSIQPHVSGLPAPNTLIRRYGIALELVITRCREKYTSAECFLGVITVIVNEVPYRFSITIIVGLRKTPETTLKARVDVKNKVCKYIFRNGCNMQTLQISNPTHLWPFSHCGFLVCIYYVNHRNNISVNDSNLIYCIK